MMQLVYLAGIAAAISTPLLPCPMPADQVIEGCHWSDDDSEWVYVGTDDPCRGTGEDPTTDSAGNPACANGYVPQEGSQVRFWCVLNASHHGHGR
jgi:hypothetical protein